MSRHCASLNVVSLLCFFGLLLPVPQTAPMSMVTETSLALEFWWILQTFTCNSGVTHENLKEDYVENLKEESTVNPPMLRYAEKFEER